MVVSEMERVERMLVWLVAVVDDRWYGRMDGCLRWPGLARLAESRVWVVVGRAGRCRAPPLSSQSAVLGCGVVCLCVPLVGVCAGSPLVPLLLRRCGPARGVRTTVCSRAAKGSSLRRGRRGINLAYLQLTAGVRPEPDVESRERAPQEVQEAPGSTRGDRT